MHNIPSGWRIAPNNVELIAKKGSVLRPVTLVLKLADGGRALDVAYRERTNPSSSLWRKWLSRDELRVILAPPSGAAQRVEALCKQEQDYLINMHAMNCLIFSCASCRFAVQEAGGDHVVSEGLGTRVSATFSIAELEDLFAVNYNAYVSDEG